MPTYSNTSSMDRKSKKPMMEKKRRARINSCLVDLKNLLLESLKKNPAETSKLEKADILEMTVHLLRSLQNRQLAMAVTMDPSVLDRYRGGWAECYQQVMHYANTVDGFNPEVRERMFRHLDSCFTGIPPPRRNLPPPNLRPTGPSDGPRCGPPVAGLHPASVRPLFPPGLGLPPGFVPRGPAPPQPNPAIPNLSPAELTLLAAAAGLSGRGWQNPGAGGRGPMRGQNRPHSDLPTPLQLAAIPHLLSNLDAAQVGGGFERTRSTLDKKDSDRHDSFLSVKTESTETRGEWSSPNTIDQDEGSDSSVFGEDEKNRSGGTEGSLDLLKEETELDVVRIEDARSGGVWRPW